MMTSLQESPVHDVVEPAAGPLKLNAPIDRKSPAWKAAAECIQGNIVTSHRRRYSALIPFTIQSSGEARAGLGNAALRWVTSAAVQEHRHRRMASETDEADQDIYGFLYLSGTGYRKLGYEEEVRKGFAPPPGEENWFLDGLKAQQKAMSFPEGAALELDAAYSEDVDGILLLASKQQHLLKEAVAEATADIETFGAVLCVEYGAVRKNENGQAVEPFGFADGISKPEVFSDAERPVFPSNLLVPDPLADGSPHAFGSYLVYLKLEQKVDEFKREVEALASAANVTPDYAGAMVIGRFPDGTPLSSSPEPNPTLTAISPDFLTAGDLAGLKCPFHAHIRKVNPRFNARGRRLSSPLFRRGVRYDYRPEASADKGGQERHGLLFLAFQADIALQFGSIMRAWVNDPKFPVDQTGTDALMGNACGNQEWRLGHKNPVPDPVPFALGRYVTFKGGEFLFAPSLTFFRKLAGGVQP